MAVAAARTAVVKQAMKPHVPLIKFPPRGSTPATQDLVNTAKKPDALDQFLNSVITDQNPASKRSTQSSNSRVFTRPSIDASQVPQKYKRKMLTKEEMEYIEKGGPV